MNVIQKKDDGWYFYNEIWTELIGSYKTKKECSVALSKYIKILNKRK